jgi:hypothetical protein
MGLAPGTLAMIPVSMAQKQGLEPMPTPAQIIDRIGSRPAQVANGLIDRFRNVDGFQFAGSEPPSQVEGVRDGRSLSGRQNASESSRELPQSTTPRADATDA